MIAQINLEKLQTLRKNGYSFREISKQTNIPLKTVWKYTSDITFSRKGVQRHNNLNGLIKQTKKQNYYLTLRKTRIISHLFFDGSHFKMKYHSIIKYVNLSEKLVKQFENDVKSVYGMKPSAKYFDEKVWRVVFSSKQIFEDLSKYSKSYSTSNILARIPDEIIFGSIKMKLELLRAFWNDEGSISANGRLSADSRSKKIIDQLISIHKQFGLNLNKTKYFVSRKPMYKIYLSKTKENTAKFIRLGLFTFSIVGRGQNKGKLKIAVTKEALNKF